MGVCFSLFYMVVDLYQILGRVHVVTAMIAFFPPSLASFSFSPPLLVLSSFCRGWLLHWLVVLGLARGTPVVFSLCVCARACVCVDVSVCVCGLSRSGCLAVCLAACLSVCLSLSHSQSPAGLSCVLLHTYPVCYYISVYPLKQLLRICIFVIAWRGGFRVSIFTIFLHTRAATVWG